MTNPKSESQKRRDEAAKKCCADTGLSPGTDQQIALATGYQLGWDARDADLKKKLGLPEGCELEMVIMELMWIAQFYSNPIQIRFFTKTIRNWVFRKKHRS